MTSDVHADSVLVTRGKTMILAAIQPSHGFLYEDPNFVAGGVGTVRTNTLYTVPYSLWLMKGRPNTSVSTTAETPLVPVVGKDGTEKHAPLSEAEIVIYWGSGLVGVNIGNASTPDDSANMVYPYLQSDVGTVIYNGSTQNARQFGGGSSVAGKVILDSVNGRYYYQPYNTASITCAIYDMGTTEPDMT